jgi:hypothetical protein
MPHYRIWDQQGRRLGPAESKKSLMSWNISDPQSVLFKFEKPKTKKLPGLTKHQNRQAQKTPTISLLCVIGLLLFNCNSKAPKERVDTRDQEESTKSDAQSDLKSLEELNAVFPDTTINGKLQMENPISSKTFYPTIDGVKLIERIRDSPVALFTNQQGDEYLMAYQYEGGTKNAFSCFEIGYRKDFASENPNKTLARNFKTESNLGLGMALKDLEAIKGKEYFKKNRDGNTILITYRINNMESSPFLKHYNMPGYFLECTLKNDRITKVFFGFDYP